MEQIYLYRLYPAYENISRSPIPAKDLPPQSLTPFFANRLRRLPRLRVIHTLWPKEEDNEDFEDTFEQEDEVEAIFTRIDALEATGDQGFINSYHYEELQLIHARFLLDIVEVDDKLAAEVPYGGPHWQWIEYDQYDGTSRTKMYEHLIAPIWLDYTDLKVGDIRPIGNHRSDEGGRRSQ